MAFCSSCGAQNKDNDKFCASCGKGLSAAQSSDNTPPPADAAAESLSSTGLQENIACLLAYLFMWIAGLVFMLIEKKSAKVKFAGAQSFVLFLSAHIIFFILSFVPIIGTIVGVIGGIAMVVLWILLMVKAYNNQEWRLPVVADLADKLAAMVK
ncbi:MAG: zinc-ribbon domain-containing protein [Dehalococcoidia bacterium]|nr:zinc-ribbon domain-containing protein [Dehalococcoidia bacterium]